MFLTLKYKYMYIHVVLIESRIAKISVKTLVREIYSLFLWPNKVASTASLPCSSYPPGKKLKSNEETAGWIPPQI